MHWEYQANAQRQKWFLVAVGRWVLLNYVSRNCPPPQPESEIIQPLHSQSLGLVIKQHLFIKQHTFGNDQEIRKVAISDWVIVAFYETDCEVYQTAHSNNTIVTSKASKSAGSLN